MYFNDRKFTHYSSYNIYGRILVLANNSVNLVPDIKANDQTKDGLIIFSSGKVSIDAENLRSTVGNLVYDEIDALVISYNQITIPTGTEDTPGSQQDGVKIIGSLLSFEMNQTQVFCSKETLGY